MIRIVLVLACLASIAHAKLLRLEVTEVLSPAFDGRGFGAAGTYDRIAARATIGVDPGDPANAGIADIERAPRNADGLVEAVSDVVILRPTDAARGNGVLLYDVVNRGRKLGLNMLNDAPLGNAVRRDAEAGNGFLMRQGYIVVWSGWQHDVAEAADMLRLVAPIVPGVTGVSREEFIWDHLQSPVTERLSYPIADPASLILTVRGKEADARQTPPGLTFRIVDPQRIEITRPPGFDAGAIYELTYQAKDPTVGGLGMAAVRDLVSFLRHETEQNPLARNGAEVSHAYGIGISQSGRFLKDMLYQGFLDDEAGRPVFDAIVPFISGARRSFTNARFSQPGRFSRQHEDHLFPGDSFPFTYGTTTDALTGQSDGLLRRCEAAGTCPRIMQVDTDSEAYQARASLIVTDTRGNHLDLPANVRAYMLAGLPHGSTPGLTSSPQPACVMASNPLHPGAAMRALLTGLDGWVRQQAEPPSSRYPMRSQGTLVAPAPGAFPALPGVAYAGLVNGMTVVDRGREPPAPGRAYPVFVPRTDADGHALAGIRLPEIEAARATYTGWNLRRAGFGEGELCGLAGGAMPLPERAVPGDPRRPLSERYAGPDAYPLAVRAAAERLVAERLMLREDADAAVSAARGVKMGSGPVMDQTKALAELAPTGTLRAAINLGNPVLVQRDETGALGGTSPDLARELARRLGVPVQLLPFESAGTVFAKAGQDVWDVAFMAIDPIRAAGISFSPPYVGIEGNYVVAGGSALRELTDVDRPGIRIVTATGSAYDLFLTRAIKQATLVRFPTGEAAAAAFVAGGFDVLAGVRQANDAVLRAHPGNRAIPGRFMAIEQAMGTPTGRSAAAAYVRAFIEEMKAGGFVAQRLAASGQTGAVVVMPPAP